MTARASTRRRAVVTATGLLTLGVAGCGWLPGGDDAESATTTQPAVLQEPVLDTSFCGQMLSIRSDALDPDSTISSEELAQRYEEAAAVAPPEIVDDLEILIEEVRSGTVSEVTAVVEGDGDGDLSGEVWTPDGTASGRVFDYVDSACAGISSNPGPAATAPE